MLAPLIPPLHRWLSAQLPLCLWEGDPRRPQVALTFDDGPHPDYTPPLLAVLAQYQVKATFFWLGAWVDRHPTLARQVYEAGHWIGLHGYTHRSFLGQSPTQIRHQLERTQQAIARACGGDPAQFIDVRPPYGICWRQTTQQIRAWGYRPCMWSVVPVDWTTPGIDCVAQRVLKHTRNGSIIVLHDGPSGGAQVAQSTQAFLPHLLTQGFSCLTVEEFWRQQR
ncbi:polysaccharide deacetylase family protein [Lyngbya confervoides]|uniref:Polysaccharide deacetylase family protein n=1 Tax=Lyngbya confervoides BDU141951 TaxID=1574623 RepID=A0ABD4T6S0_9CYAN|nr:polysaccharide deacetylase family protein [Lyngbya confervoides]MCM1984260.1 polysaccharide deacetylase family protein [Lyngbya confervoides BDU141951]